MNREIQQRLQWVKLYETSGDAGFVCRRPKRSPSTKTGTCEVALILELRSQRNLGARRIQSELKRLHSISLAIATIHKVLFQNQV
ncbi:IS481 family transposase, partial [Escherichia coli]